MGNATRLIGTPVNRVDGRQKVTGRALYAAEFAGAGATHGVLVGSAIASGRVRRIDATAAERAPGVLLVMTHQNRGPLGAMPDGSDWTGMPSHTRPPLEDACIHHADQAVALVVARTLEQARYAASLVHVMYEPAPFAVAMVDALSPPYSAERVYDEDLAPLRGDPRAALASAEVRLDVTYTSPNEHPCAMEPHATVACWSGDTLTIYDSTQWVMGDQAVLAAALGLPRERVVVLAPFVGGMFGSKVTTGPHTILAALASLRLGQPVKIVLGRAQVLALVGHRTETVQRLEIGATRTGALVAMCHHTRTHTAVGEEANRNEFREPTSTTSRLLYACPNYAADHECVRLNVTPPGWMRAPGECPGQWALESAMDELAYALDLDPLELRRRNHTDADPQSKLPFSSKHLLACYERGAQRFGWQQRDGRPRSLRDGDTLIGWGMATATYPGWQMGATVRVRLELQHGPDPGVRAHVSTAGIDVGTGMYTMMALAAAEWLGLPLDCVSPELGDSRLAPCAPAGGSNLTASTAPAISDACASIRRQLLELAAHYPGFEHADQRAGEFSFADGRIARGGDRSRSIGMAELLARSGRPSLAAEGRTVSNSLRDERFAFQSFGAHFVEVRVQPDICRVRVTRVVSVFDVGRVLNARATRSQLIGAIVFGIGQALFEELIYDRDHGHAVNADLAGYLVPVQADVPDIDVSWIDEPDFHFNSVGCRGVGEIGITGMAAAIANAVYHATGKRIRDLPITPDKLL